MRTDKHKLILNLEQETKLIEIMKAYQLEKNFFSDRLNSYSWNSSINFWQGCSYREIRSSLVAKKYVPQNPLLPARAWKLALEEAFQLHERTKLGQFYFYTNFKEENAKKLKLYHLSEPEKHVLNYIFFSWKNFIKFSKIVFDYKFVKNKKALKGFKVLFYENFSQYMEKVFLPHLDRQLKLKKENLTEEEKDSLREIKKLKASYEFYKTSHKLINKLVYISKQIFQTKQILTKINPTMRLDSGCYNLYQDKDGNNYLDIFSLDKGKRIKGIKLTGFKGSLPRKHSTNLIVSLNSTDMSFYIHFSFKAFKAFKNKNSKSKNYYKKEENIINKEENIQENILGMDFGETEFGTLSDGYVIGKHQGKILSQIANKTEQLLVKIQEKNLLGYFGVEKTNKEGKRNHANNCFNHNLRNKNINLEYRQQQEKTNRRLDNLKYLQVKELIDYCQLNNITQLILENLNFNQLKGINKRQRKNINLIKNSFELLEQTIKNNSIDLKISYTNPAYTSQTCPDCFFTDRENRKREEFRCQHCGFIPQQDVRYKKLFLDNPNLSGADFVAALNIKAFHFHEDLKDSLFLKKEKIKDLILNIHESKKESFCKA